jgi:heme/copper-type cytochrome/quinol oxidase subunit 1
MITDQKPSFRRWYLAFTIVIAAVLLILAIRGVSWPEMADTMPKADPKYMVFIFLLGSLSVFMRGLRWGVLISAEKQIKALTMFWAIDQWQSFRIVLSWMYGFAILLLFCGTVYEIIKGNDLTSSSPPSKIITSAENGII